VRPRGENIEYDKLADRFYASNRAIDAAEALAAQFKKALVAVCERGDTDHSAKSMYWIASDALKAAGFNSNGKPLTQASDAGVKSE
jgi:hypothetical protein